jgi:hypothetical protein
MTYEPVETRGVVLRGVLGFLGILLWTVTVSATQVRCPVCHQLFPREVEVCPHDGTDLKILGRVEQRGKSEDGTDTEAADAPEDSTASDPDGTRQGQPVPKYQRHDIGGARKRMDVSPEDDVGDVERRDRLLRLKDARAGWTPPTVDAGSSSDEDHRRRQEALLAEYGTAREQSAADRQRRASQQDLEKERRRRERDALFSAHVPAVSMGSRLFFMGEGDSPGVTPGVEVDANLIRTNVRVGLTSFVGVRHIGNRRDLLFQENIALGIQHPWHLSPFLLFRAGLGVMLSERFGEQNAYLVRTIGVDVGMDCRIGKMLMLSPSIGYTRLAVSAAGWDTVSLKVSVGF